MIPVKVSSKGQVVIFASIRRRLGITPGCLLDLSVKGGVIHAQMKRQIVPSRPEDGFGMLVCTKPGIRRLADFDVADALR